MPRLRFQSKDILYEVVSIIEFESVGRQRQKTYYSDEHGITKKDILAIARQNIERKLLETSGKIISVKIKAVYQ